MNSAISELLPRNRGPNPRQPGERVQPNYGLGGELVGGVLNVELTFLAGEAYCCMEWGCHIRMKNGKRWSKLRQQFASQGVAAPSQITLQLKCVVEEGALFFDLSRPASNRKGWYEFKPAESYEYQVSQTEALTDEATESTD